MALTVALFFLSGATALVGEVVWMRMLGLVLGNTVWAASAAVAVWMGGMAIGAAVGGRLAPRTRRHLRWYGLAEAAIGLFYGLSPGLHRLLLDAGARLGSDLGGSLAVGIAERMALAAAALILPTVLMGLTLPLLVERLRGAGRAVRVGLLYGVNTLGATAGVFAAAYLALPLLGERGALAAAGLVCAAVAATAIAAEGHVGASAGGSVEGSGARPGTVHLLLVAAMGAAALAAELVWVRILVLHLGSRVYAFAVLLGVYLLGLAIGSLAVWRLAPRVRDPERALAAAQVLVALALGLQLLALGHTDDLLGLLPRLVTLPATFVAVQGMVVAAVCCLFLPVTALYGASFPLAVAANPGRGSAGAHTGAVAAANTLGAIVGTLAAPFLLVPAIGCQRTLLVLAVVHLGVAVALRRSPLLVGGAGVAAGLVACLWLLLPGDWVVRSAGSGEAGRVELVSLEESLSATVLVKRYHDPAGTWLSLELNGVNVAGSDPALLAVQQLQGHLPLLQVARPRRVLHIGFGSGGTCWALSRHPVERIDVVEIAPEVLAAADTYFAPINHHVLADPRLRVVVNDGRNYLLATAATYDAVLSDSIHPVYAGNSTLYTLEYFRMCRERLEPGGVVSMWLPLYGLDRDSYLRILAAFAAVFPRAAVWYDVTTVNEFSVVTGAVEPGPLKLHWERLKDPRVAASLAIAGVAEPADLAADLLLGPAEVAALVADVPPHDDDLPFVEYTAGRILARERTWLDNLRLLVAVRARTSPFADLPLPWSEVMVRRDRNLERILATLERSAPGPPSGG
jgi:spermidine synthase